MRGKHCSRCGYCVRKYDHHCFFVSGCIGENNHFKFLFYLFTQSITLLMAIGVILDTISFYLDKTNEKYYKVPIILYPLLIILALYALLTVFIIK
jgi:palmitoyltransferase